MTGTEDTNHSWAEYKRTGADALRQQLVLHYASLVKYVASRVATGLPNSVEQGDLVSYGMFGLLDAIDKFDPERGFKFETYAIPRIRGAILDELRSMDWVPRSVRAKSRRIEQAMATFENANGRSPSEEELASLLDIGLDDLRDTLGQIARGGILGLDEMVGAGGEGVTVGDTVADNRDLGPGAQLEASEVRRILASSIDALPERERMVLALYYYETMTLAEIGTILGVSESRVCQIHGKAVLQLRARMLAATREA
jgi:RNA polymerase sigma factor for flagellar operon FliA